VNDKAETVTVTVDPELCTASAVCTFIAPTIFELDNPAGPVRCTLATIEDPALIALAREAAAACPTNAIRIS
jgi:ferredoxin